MSPVQNKIPFLDLSVSDETLKSEIRQKFLSLTESAVFIGGKPVGEFSEAFARYCGGGFCAPVGNGTDALALALKALGLGPGSEVIIPSFTFVASAEAVTLAGARVQFVDVHPKTFTMDVSLLKKKITEKTKAIMPVHLFGQPCDMDPILEIARKHKIVVLEDAAQAHGAEYKGRRVGTLGQAGCFSFYPTKNLGAFGDGGAVVSKNREVIMKVNQLANHGRSAQYFHEVEGQNSRLDSLQAAILQCKLAYLDQWNNRRRQIAERYSIAILKNKFIDPPFIESYAKHVFHLYCLQSSFRDNLKRYLEENGVSSQIYYPLPLHLQPAYSSLNLKPGSFPVSEQLSERILSLPIYPNLSDEAVAYICGVLERFSPEKR